MSAVKKAPQKTTPKKPVAKKAAKKTVAKKTTKVAKKTATKKATAKSTARKKPVAKSTAVKRVAAKRPAATTKAKKSAQSSTPKSDQSVKVPTNAPLRSVEKAAVLRSELSLTWEKSMHTVAYVSGFCFLLIGATLAGASTFTTQSAAIENSALVATAPNAQVQPQLSLHSPIPSTLTEPAKVLFTLSYVQSSSVYYYLVKQDTQKSTNKRAAQVRPENKYSFTLQPSEYEAGQYTLYVQYTQTKPQAGNKKAEAVAKLVVPVKEKELVSNQSHNSEMQVAATSSEETVESVTQTSTTTKQQLKTNLETDSATKITQAVPNLTEFSLYTKQTEVSGVLALQIAQSKGLRDLELYARPMASLNARFLTRASRRADDASFIVDTQSLLPNGKYEFYAKGINNNGQEQTTPSVQLIVNNTKPLSVVEESVSTTDQAAEQRDFANLKLDDSSTSESTNEEVKAASNQLLAAQEEVLTEAFENYALAKQSENVTLIKAAQERLTEKKIALFNTVLLNPSLTTISDEVIAELTAKLDSAQDRIDTFETVRREKSDGKTAVDTDKDGISDYDEFSLYGTDPQEPDTDGDGFLDGIEIMRGYDPLDDMAEVVIDYESPKNTLGIVVADEFVIDEVIPVINSVTGSEDETVRAQIVGRALPNSFVTLFIYSSPTIATVKTDSDGSFAYTLDKELADGAHQLYVAMTDNTGTIIAQSKPFLFTKEGQTFTMTATTKSNPVDSRVVTPPAANDSYNAIMGLGVLALGLVLLLLGLSLRSRGDEQDTEQFKRKTA